ncbi:uncharacterized protein MELLADRAFT_65531 [Melampsora larici-populina 98AG31]|uniref:Uncharacterized protein n=1 Tax=Melampsora larici-populina (strain 98AG31 / pathotype 3-4-7) TaxID=747676 RepID=F4RVS1_MELLP|nr:uncharacterized protein MELLADRAFT_65531 [Melampsora larici-populina 98AG31]EGG03536.1 hypothetical protein MELLADRAFT_65531 [Melampsora larici-populina 98AG31]
MVQGLNLMHNSSPERVVKLIWLSLAGTLIPSEHESQEDQSHVSYSPRDSGLEETAGVTPASSQKQKTAMGGIMMRREFPKEQDLFDELHIRLTTVGKDHVVVFLSFEW